MWGICDICFKYREIIFKIIEGVVSFIVISLVGLFVLVKIFWLVYMKVIKGVVSEMFIMKEIIEYLELVFCGLMCFF